MTAVSEFLAMGGYARFVWPAFAVAAVIMVGLLVLSRRGLRANEMMLRRLQTARRARAGDADSGEADDA